jgi:FHS family glucose/mannose:H+ symporter-like MFS transporter
VSLDDASISQGITKGIAKELTRIGFAKVTASFAMMGFTATCWGAIVPWLAGEISIPLSTMGVLYGVFLFHTLVGTLTVQALSKQHDLHWFIRLGISLTLIGFLGIFLSPTPIFVAIFAAIGGFGYGGTGISFLLLITRCANASHFRMNVVSAATGIGALLGPLSISILGQDRIPVIVITSVVGALMTAWNFPDAKWRFTKREEGAKRSHKPLPLILVIIGVVFYSGLENSIGAWIPTVAVNTGLELEQGTLFSSVFYLLFTAGRFLGVWLSTRVSAESIVLAMVVLTAVPLALAWGSKSFPLVALIIAGLFLGPIFPNTSSWVAKRTPDFPAGTTLLMLAVMGGGFLFPPLIGYSIEGASPNQFAAMLLPLLAISIFFFLIGGRLWRKSLIESASVS